MTASIISASASPTEHIAATAFDFDEVASADAVVALPGADDLAEVIFAGVIGVPVVALADALSAGRSEPDAQPSRLTPRTRPSDAPD